jgi:hypothetical protein
MYMVNDPLRIERNVGRGRADLAAAMGALL